MKRFRVKRKSEKWVSNNRVLLGSSKKDPGRNPNFDTEETKLLISLWGDPTVQRTLITTHRKHTVIAKLAEQMNDYGYNRSTEEINTRIKNLKCFYNRLKKDMDVGSINAITWKHYTAMDEIMTRSIFSVRPNEIPKPSLKYQLEQELEEKRMNKLGGEISDVNGTESPNNFQILDENSCSSMSSKGDNDEQINSDGSMDNLEKLDGFSETKGDEDLLKLFKTEIEDAPLIIPKDEPVDDDVQIITDDIITNSPETLAPILSEYIQVATSNSSPAAHFSNSSTTVNSNQNSLLKASQPASVPVPKSIVFTNPSTNGISAQGKISLVPTNFLLQKNSKQSQPQQIQIRPQPHQQQRIICTQPNNQANTGIVSSAGNGRMKVLFVNAFQNGNAQNVSAPKEFPLTNQSIITNPSLISSSNNKQQAEPAISMNYIEHPNSNPKPLRVVEEASDVNNRDQCFELLFNKLIDMQNENNQIQRQQLELARQRLEFEKSMANKFLEALVSLKPVPTVQTVQTQESTNISNLRKRSANSEDLTNIDKSIIPDIIDEFNNYHLLTPKIEKID